MKAVGTCMAPLCLCLVLTACDNDPGKALERPVSAPRIVDVGPLQLWCAQCHAPPSPRLHKRDEWPLVVRRMQHHRLDARMPPVPDDARKSVVAWLQKHARL